LVVFFIAVAAVRVVRAERGILVRRVLSRRRHRPAAAA
jgi:hypothetical protein